MENTNTKIRENGFKVTPKWLEAIGIDLDNWPTVPEALKAKKEADILLHQGMLILHLPFRYFISL